MLFIWYIAFERNKNEVDRVYTNGAIAISIFVDETLKSLYLGFYWTDPFQNQSDYSLYVYLPSLRHFVRRVDWIAWMVISLTKTSSETQRLVYHVFGIVGKLFKNVGEWYSFHADTLKSF